MSSVDVMPAALSPPVPDGAAASPSLGGMAEAAFDAQSSPGGQVKGAEMAGAKELETAVEAGSDDNVSVVILVL